MEKSERIVKTFPSSILNIKRAYDEISLRYAATRNVFDNISQLKLLNQLLSKQATILDVGCGPGIPVIKYFVDHGHYVTGVDISPKMLELAKQNVPNVGLLLNKDMVDMDFENSSFDLITSFYSIFHVARPKHEEIFRNFYRFLKKGGFSYFTLAGEKYTEHKAYQGTKCFENMRLPYNHYSIERYKKILEQIGFKIHTLTDMTIGEETMTWVLVEK